MTPCWRHTVDVHDYEVDWELDEDLTDPRLYGVEEDGYWVAFDHSLGWTDDDLREQWRKERGLDRLALMELVEARGETS